MAIEVTPVPAPSAVAARKLRRFMTVLIRLPRFADKVPGLDSLCNDRQRDEGAQGFDYAKFGGGRVDKPMLVHSRLGSALTAARAVLADIVVAHSMTDLGEIELGEIAEWSV